VVGITLAGMVASVPLWVLALLLAGAGIGIANTGSLGLLIEAVPVDRIVSAAVVWSQLGIIGYLLGPLAGGMIAEELGYGAVGLVPAAAAAVAAAMLLPARRATAQR
jgi:MFS family permease